MSHVSPLVCPRCGGPLQRPEALPSLVGCVYCGATVSVSPGGAIASTTELAASDRQERRRAFTEALVARLKSGAAPFDALRDSVREHLDLGPQAEVAARVALGLVADFERESGAVVANDPLVLSRVAEAYLKSLDDLRLHDAAEIDLPFLAATASGPKHLKRTVTPASFAAYTRPPAARPKKGWWPFG